MKKELIAFVISLFWGWCIYAQPVTYSASQAHSHNDYEQAQPFHAAWQQGFGSIEADIFLVDGELVVAHDTRQAGLRRTLDSLYLRPLQQCIKNNNGYVYADTAKRLQLMIDIKTEAYQTLGKLVEKLQAYPLLINCPSLKIAISGNRPLPDDFKNWPSWIWFDGELRKDYNKEQLEKIVMLSDNFANYSSWKGKGKMPDADKVTLHKMVQKAHLLKKKIRFWNAPDNIVAWNYFASLGVDYLNTDHIKEIAAFFSQ